MQILGLDFFDGTPARAVDRALENRGLIVAPSGTCFRRLQRDEIYHDAMLHADLVLPDSGFMVLLWQFLRGERLQRISGLAYLKELLDRAEFRQDRTVLWIAPNESAKGQTLRWLQMHGFSTTAADVYVAPIYGERVEDSVLLGRLQSQQTGHLVIALSGGVQEKLGAYLRAGSNHRPAIHCIGGALGFVTGYQVSIPGWADRFYLGWLFRLFAQPRVFVPRLWRACELPFLIFKYGENLPPLAEARRIV